MSEETQVDRKDLKIQAYREKLSKLEEENADLRVELTFAEHMLQRQHEELETLRTPDVKEDPDASEDSD